MSQTQKTLSSLLLACTALSSQFAEAAQPEIKPRLCVITQTLAATDAIVQEGETKYRLVDNRTRVIDYITETVTTTGTQVVLYPDKPDQTPLRSTSSVVNAFRDLSDKAKWYIEALRPDECSGSARLKSKVFQAI